MSEEKAPIIAANFDDLFHKSMERVQFATPANLDSARRLHEMLSNLNQALNFATTIDQLNDFRHTLSELVDDCKLAIENMEDE